jgi:hypothetical protein
MVKEKLLDIVENTENKSNKDLIDAEEFIFNEYERSKKLAIELVRMMEGLEEMHGKVIKELEKRKTI